jgi:hypothetical protein
VCSFSSMFCLSHMICARIYSCGVFDILLTFYLNFHILFMLGFVQMDFFFMFLCSVLTFADGLC